MTIKSHVVYATTSDLRTAQYFCTKLQFHINSDASGLNEGIGNGKIIMLWGLMCSWSCSV
eukprot:m.25293 g.25293  ORF g.25293 m.25293 type:complete len:60 (+) comp13154_c0_seq2:240-419(+)